MALFGSNLCFKKTKKGESHEEISVNLFVVNYGL